MRSRYSAFARGEGEYLVATQAEPADAAALAAFGLGVRWLGLHVFERTQGAADDRVGTVAFVARFEQDGVQRALVERSTFDRVEGPPHGADAGHPAGRWRYLRGGPPRLGPTSRCPCGRGRPYGRCCGR